MHRLVFGSWRAQIAALVLVALPACGVEVPDGLFACGDDTECPAGWTCRQPEDRCYRAPGEDDAALADGGGGADAGHDGDASAPPDGGPPDEDRDGVPDASDCAPLDATVGVTASRSCVGACGGGLETCTDGAWTECDAPTVCDCIEDATQTIPCGFCGSQSQLCTEGRWVDVGACSGGGVCAPGTTDLRDEQACLGGCGTMGTQFRTRTCDDACGWGDWSAFSACASCAPAIETVSQACGDCGRASRTRSCDTASCTWAPWGAPGACNGQGECTPDDSNALACACGAGQSGLREQLCSASCEWGAWGLCECF